MSHPLSSRTVWHTLTALITVALMTVALQSWTTTVNYEPAKWWNFNGGPYFWWKLFVAAGWAVFFADLVEESYTLYQRTFEQTMHIAAASMLAWLAVMLQLGHLPWWGFGLLILLTGVIYGILEDRRRSGVMANLFTALVVGFAFGPIAFVVWLVFGFIVTAGVASINATISDDRPY